MRVEVAKAPVEHRDTGSLELLCTLCYYYPQYTLAEARKLPYKHVRMLLREARVQKAIEWHWLTHIAIAPHTEKGKGVKALQKMLKEYIK